MANRPERKLDRATPIARSLLAALTGVKFPPAVTPLFMATAVGVTRCASPSTPPCASVSPACAGLASPWAMFSAPWQAVAQKPSCCKRSSLVQHTCGLFGHRQRQSCRYSGLPAGQCKGDRVVCQPSGSRFSLAGPEPNTTAWSRHGEPLITP